MRPHGVTATDYGHCRDLLGPVPERRYRFVEHTIRASRATPFRCHPRDYRTFLVLRGQVAVERPPEFGGSSRGQYGYLAGWHALPGSVYRIANRGGGPAVVLEAGSLVGEHIEPSPHAPRPWTGTPTFPGVSTCAVDHPWGREIRYTENVPDARYTVQQIAMAAGHRSSLRSPGHRAETCHVIDGAATVLSGLPHPNHDTVVRDTVVDVERLARAVHSAGSAWTSPLGESHLVIAHTDCAAIVVSTPEPDGVARLDESRLGPVHSAEEHRTG